MDFNRQRAIINRIHGKIVALIIGWIGLALSAIGVPLLWFCYGDAILYIVIIGYDNDADRVKIWLIYIIIACVFYFLSCILWLWAIAVNKNTKFMVVSLVWWWLMLSLWIRLVTVTGETSFYVLTLFLLAYYIIAVFSFLTIRKPVERRIRPEVPTAPMMFESVDPMYPLVA